MIMYTLGHEAETHQIRSDGLRYYAAAPIIGSLKNSGLVKAMAPTR
jgi:predicted alternative tryptophan synthase beta-subunit